MPRLQLGLLGHGALVLILGACPSDDTGTDSSASSSVGETSTASSGTSSGSGSGSGSASATSTSGTTTASTGATSTASSDTSGSDSSSGGGGELVTCTDGGSECDDDSVCFLTRSCPPDGFCAPVGWASCPGGFGSECDDPNLVCMSDGTVDAPGICVTFEFLDLLCPAQNIGCWDACPVR